MPSPTSPPFTPRSTAPPPPRATGRLVTFGITADRPETGYGYIKRGAAARRRRRRLRGRAPSSKSPTGRAPRPISPPAIIPGTAASSCSPRRSISRELERLQPDTVAACRRALGTAKRDLDFLRLDKDAFAQGREQIDRLRGDGAYAPRRRGAGRDGLERCRHLGRAVASSAARTRPAMSRVGDVVAEDTKRSYLRAEHGLLVDARASRI